MEPVRIRRLRRSDAEPYRELRLEALVAHPEAFAASFTAELAQSTGWHAGRLERHPVFGGGFDGGLDGMGGLFVSDAPKTRHKATIWGLYVRPACRGHGLGRALLEHAMGYAASTVEELRLSVTAASEPAMALYRRAGFREYGREPRAIKIAGRYQEEILMGRPAAR